MTQASLIEQFWSRVRRSDGCWEWSGPFNGNGYPAFCYAGRVVGAHRFIYEIERGAIADGFYVCHHCDNPKCVRPDHLFLGSPKDNTSDMDKKGRRRTVAPQGVHARSAKLTEEQVRELRNLYAAGWSFADLGRRFGLRTSPARRVALRMNWKHLP